ncbi:MAG: RDD family protein [Betaproteobacteria bacterium]|nr:MAG: RDD family protein [Betaproteobacteria bacterium]
MTAAESPPTPPQSPTPLRMPDAAVPTVRAGLWRRFGALVHELFFLVAYLFIVALAFAAFSGESMSTGKPMILTGAIATLQQLYLFASLGAYFVFFWTRHRRTLAFKTWQLRLQDVQTSELTLSTKRAIVRYLAVWIGPALGLLIYLAFGPSARGWWILALFTNFLWAFVDPAKQFLHDRIAGSRVVYQRE